MAIAIVEELWTRIRAAIDDKIVAATNARDQAVTAKNGAVTAQTAAETAAANAANATLIEVNKLKGSAPAAFDTLAEIATELAENETDRAALTNSIAAKADTGFGDVVDTHTSGDFDTLDLSAAGLYRIRGGTGYVTNMPLVTAGLWWNVVLVSTMEPTGANAKLYFAHSATSVTVYCRTKYGTTWGAWTPITTAAPSSMIYGVGTAATPTTTGYAISASTLQQVLKYFLTGSPTTDPTAIGQSLMTATDAADARAKIGAAAVGEGGGISAEHTHTAANISDATATGRSVLTASSQADARAAIGAGTSNLALGTTSSTAKAGNYQPTAAQISDATTVGRAVLKAADAAAARTAIGAAAVGEGGGAWVLTTTIPTSPDPDTLYLIPED